ILLKNEERYKDALKELTLARQSLPNKPDLLFQIGMTYKAEGNCQEAVSNLEKFLMAAKRDEGPFARMKSEAVRAIKECRSGTKQKPFEKKPLKYR
ncbi:MAG: hypothetical protein Q8K77_04950, partial [Thermodesulfovibrionales bacterium]|nr:hypothetical protein [Thermodesulfovibrionales bacterium]